MKLKQPTTSDYPNHIVSEPPIRERRLSGVHWWDPDRLNHLDDLPAFCPRCGVGIVDKGGIAVEYWQAEERIYHIWCHECGWSGDITKIHRMTSHETEH
ncbi:MAG: hypothetical protein ACR2ME_00130 [Acidimicrobiia bacterium]